MCVLCMWLYCVYVVCCVCIYVCCTYVCMYILTCYSTHQENILKIGNSEWKVKSAFKPESR